MVGSMFFEGRTNVAFEMRNIVGNEVRQESVLGMAPRGVHGIEFRRVGRQELEVDVLHPSPGNLLRRRAMNAPAIPADDQWTPKLLSQLLNEGDHLGSADILFPNLEGGVHSRPRRRNNDRTDHAQPIVPIPRALHRSLAYGGPGATVHRLQAEAGFVDKNNASSELAGFFLMRGQSTFRHRSTASGSCSRATCRGFCGLNPKSCRMRDRWPGWYFTRNFLRTTSATRAQVQRSVRYPAAIGPAKSLSFNSCFCSSVSLDGVPGWGLGANAFTPPDFHARLQRLTLERLAPTSRAVSARDFLAWKYSAARRRRASSSAALPLVLMNHNTVLAEGRVHSERKDQ